MNTMLMVLALLALTATLRRHVPAELVARSDYLPIEAAAEPEPPPPDALGPWV